MKIWKCVLGIVVLSVGCNRTSQQPVRAASAPAKVTVAVARAELTPMADDLVLTAEFAPFQEVDVMAKLSGYVKKVYVDVGDRVNQGQLLAVLEVPELEDEMVKASAGMLDAQELKEVEFLLRTAT